MWLGVDDIEGESIGLKEVERSKCEGESRVAEAVIIDGRMRGNVWIGVKAGFWKMKLLGRSQRLINGGTGR